MVDIEYIRKKHFVEDWSIRKISKELGVSRQSVRKALASTEIPKYNLTKPRPCPVLDKFRGIIDAWLAEDERAPKKQRHTARRIYDRLVAEYGFTGGESTVRHYVAQVRRKAQEVFIPLEAAWGEQAQVDWGQAQIKIAGVQITAHLFFLRMRSSRVPFVRAYPTEKMEAFLDGHCRAFEWLGGVPRHLVYDNLKTAVVRILAGPLREEHTVFSQLKAHYLFESDFCNPGQGNEKGSTENLVGYVRRNILVPMPEFPSWEAFNEYLLSWCERERERLSDGWAMEKAALMPLPVIPFRASVTRLGLVNRLSLVTFDRNSYSVPSHYVGRSLRLEAYWDRLEVYDKDKLVAGHKRVYGRGQKVMELEHYLPVLAQKPRAVINATVIRRLPGIYAEVRERLFAAHPNGYKDFLEILLLHQEFSATKIQEALAQALEKDCLKPPCVRQILLNLTAQAPPKPVTVPEKLALVNFAPPNPEHYDDLLLKGVAGS